LKKIKLRIGSLNKRHYRELYHYLENILRVDPLKYIPSKLYYTCFDEICFIHEEAGRLNKASLIYSGLWIGLIINDNVYLSPQLYEKIYYDTGFKASIIVNDIATKNFLYGRDILEESILEKYPPLSNPISVVDHRDRRVIGVAEYVGKGIYKNIYDLGWFLRIFG